MKRGVSADGLERPATDGSVQAPARRPAALPAHRQGFTLLELLVTVSIISILTVIGVPSFRDMMASRSVQSQVDDLAGSIRLARTEALKRGLPVTLCRTADANAASPACASATDWSTGWLVFVDRAPRGAVGANDTVIRVQQAYTNSGGILRTGTAVITFIPAGIAPGADGNFMLRPKIPTSASAYPKLSRRVCVNNSGATRLIVGEGAC